MLCQQQLVKIGLKIFITIISIDFLKKFISLSPNKREREEKLEQLRIIDKTKISVVQIEKEILGVDTKEDLDTVNQQIQIHV